MEPLQPGEAAQYLSFYIKGEEYALSILRVKEIIEFDVLTQVPGTPAWMRGVINLRGTVVPVMDLSVKFGLEAIAPGRRSCIVMVEVELGGRPAIMGLLADAVSQVIEPRAEDIERPPAFGTQIHADYLKGMIKAGKKFVLLLDIDRVLSHDEVVLMAAVDAPVEQGRESVAHADV